MTGKIWSVSAGEYEGYRIVAMFTTKEKAEAFLAGYVAPWRNDNPEIEEFDLDPEPETPDVSA